MAQVGPIIRPETADDHAAIGHVTEAAFLGRPYADGDEAEIVEVLRRDGALSVSLVAELSGVVVGHIALSPATPSDASTGWYALGPVSVLPEHQRRGIGVALVNAALHMIVARGAEGCILTGDPGYYARFGFTLSPSNAPPGEPPEYFMVKLLSQGRLPSGPIAFHRAFGRAR